MSTPKSPKSPAKPKGTTTPKAGRRDAIVKNARDAAANAAVEAERIVRASADNAKKFAFSAADFAVDQGKRGAKLVETAFEKEFNKRYPHAVENVARIRKAHSAKSPAEVLRILEREFSSAETTYGDNSAKFVEAIGLYVLSAVEVHGKHVKSVNARAALVNIVLVGTNPVVIKVAPWVAFVLSLLSKRLAKIGVAAAVANKAGEKAKPLIDKAKKGAKNAGAAAKLLEINEPVKRSIGWATIRATRSALGPAPAKWPAAPKPAATKPVAKKPAAKPKPTKTA